MAASYKRMLQLIEKWPVDKTKHNRDLGEYLRIQLKEAFASRKFDIASEDCDKKYFSLKRIADDHYFKKYPRHSKSSASGLTGEQCHKILSAEFLELLEQEDQPLIKRFFSLKTRKE